MPVYSKRNRTMTPPSLRDDLPVDNPTDFITDPDQFRDRLPQPFRMIDKVVGSILDNAWEIISSRESERVREATRIRPPQYECGIQLQDHTNACSMGASPDGKYIFIGLPNGLVAVESLSQETCGIWEQDNAEITCINTSQLSEDMYIICTIDDMGIGRVFGMAGNVLLLIQNMNEQDTESKMLTGKLEASQVGDYLGVFLESPSGDTCCLEIHKTPRDSWIKDLESLAAKASKNTALNKPSSPQPTEAGVEFSHPSEGPQGKQADAPEMDQASQASGSPRGRTSPTIHKFTNSQAVLRVRPPTPVNGVSWSSPLQLAKTVDQGDTVGTGSNHQLSTNHLEMRKAVFEHFNKQYLPYLPKYEQKPALSPSFHFMSPGRFLPYGLETNLPEDQSTCVAVWWAENHQILHYSLVKTAKEREESANATKPSSGAGSKKKVIQVVEDIDHKAPELVWPLGHRILTSAMTPCSSLLAVALQNGSIVVWDMKLGIQRRVVNVMDESAIVKLSFLDPSASTQDEESGLPYTLSTSCYLLVSCKDGQLYLVHCGPGNESLPQDVSIKFEKPEEVYSSVRTVPGIPKLVLTSRQNGSLFLQDVLTSRVLCQVTLPSPWQLVAPWDPITAVGSQGQMLFIKATCPPESRSDTQRSGGSPSQENPSDQHGLFVFQLRSFPVLDNYRQEQRPTMPYVIHTTAEKRMDAILKDRIASQPARRQCTQGRWNRLKDELTLIQQMKETAKIRQNTRSAFNSMNH